MHHPKDDPEGEVEELAEGVWDDDFLDNTRDYYNFLDMETVYAPLNSKGPMWRTKEMAPLPPRPQLANAGSFAVESSSTEGRPVHNMAIIPFPRFPSWTYPCVDNPLAPRDLPRKLKSLQRRMLRFDACTIAYGLELYDRDWHSQVTDA
ncbi:uncharacterized protein LOC122063302 isoform X1 [Macadamia integrifolia]|uniref:uncharacterized protein LOC122063302 isoform X1 n=1 Tax=Macadamia integrifolia TaxID=60698 RepID=UPI001C4FA995|nr:uncharacterized protein LOC122063302 isoform X1 [Macadamia integrifolia]